MKTTSVSPTSKHTSKVEALLIFCYIIVIVLVWLTFYHFNTIALRLWLWRIKILTSSVYKLTIENWEFFSSLAIVEDECEAYSRKGGRKKMMIHHKGYNHRSAKSLSKLLKTQYALTQNLTCMMARTALFWYQWQCAV